MEPQARLIVQGALVVALAALFALAAAAHLVLAAGVLPLPPETSVDPRAAASGAMLYGAVAIVLGILGAGSIRARRWAPPLIRTAAWIWLIAGAMAAVSLPPMLAGSGAAAPWAVLVIVEAVVVAGGVIVPALLVWAYAPAALVEACRSRDRDRAWTDRCPPAVLGLSVGLAALAVAVLPLATRPAVPVFGRLVTGRSGLLLLLALAGLAAVLAVSTFRLERRGWWGTLVLFAAGGLSAVITLVTLEARRFWEALGYPDAQAELLARAQPVTIVLTVLTTVGGVLWVLALGRHFKRRS